MVGGTVLLATIYYIIWGRKSYTPPNETIEDYIDRYQGSETSAEREPNGVFASSTEKETSAGLVEEKSVEADKKDM